MFRASTVVGWPEKEEMTIKGDQGKSAKDPPTVKLVFSLEHKDSGWMNSENVP